MSIKKLYLFLALFTSFQVLPSERRSLSFPTTAILATVGVQGSVFLLNEWLYKQNHADLMKPHSFITSPGITTIFTFLACIMYSLPTEETPHVWMLPAAIAAFTTGCQVHEYYFPSSAPAVRLARIPRLKTVKFE